MLCAMPLPIIAGNLTTFLNNYNAYSLLSEVTHFAAAAVNIFTQARAETIALISEDVQTWTEACSVDQSELNLRRIGPSGGSNLTVYPPDESPERDRVVDAFFAFVQQQKPDVVGLCASYESSIWFLNRAKAQNVNPNAFIASNIVTDPRFVNETTLKTSFIVDRSAWFPRAVYNRPVPVDDACIDLSPIGCVDGAMLDAWMKQNYGGTIPLEHAYTFATFQVLSQALVLAGTDVVDNIISVLRSTQFSTVLGDTFFGRRSHMSVRDTFIRQLHPDEARLISPAQIANGVLVYPRPTWAQAACSSTHACGGHGVCTPDGSCDCAFGWSGSTCTVQYEIPMFLFAGLLAA
ncbi:MAG: hypothetical protein EOO65_04800, partial [Methanosarcinales archaeon]